MAEDQLAIRLEERLTGLKESFDKFVEETKTVNLEHVKSLQDFRKEMSDKLDGLAGQSSLLQMQKEMNNIRKDVDYILALKNKVIWMAMGALAVFQLIIQVADKLYERYFK